LCDVELKLALDIVRSIPRFASIFVELKDRAHSSQRANAQGLPHPSARKAAPTPPMPPDAASDTAPPAS
jgi:hypothetical protein